ncbi:CotH kinase family protein [bacterium]|nr:CotH kinase family protein [bacterium]
MKKFPFCMLFSLIFIIVGCGDSSSGIAPENMYVAPYIHSIAIPCKAETKDGNATYQWYESTDGSTSSGVAVQGATDMIFTTPVYNRKGIYYYYCTATVEGKTAISNVSSVAYTALPTLYLNTPDGVEITSNEDWMDDATISVVGAHDENWDFDNLKTSIKGKGTASWERPKKNYTLRLQKNSEIMGMPEEKRWILLANYRDKSFMRNETAFYLSETFKMSWTPHGEFVDLVLNGEYKGLYWFGETVKVDENRVNLYEPLDIFNDDDKSYLLETEEDSADPLYFQSGIRKTPYIVKNENWMLDNDGNITSGGKGRLERLNAKINVLEKLLYPDFTEGMETAACSAPNEGYSTMLDTDSWIKFWLVNEIMDNKKLETPEDCFFTFNIQNIFKAGPVWDFETASLYQRSSCTQQNTLYYDALFKSPAFTARTKELWDTYYSRTDIETFIESTRDAISTAARYDLMLWGSKSNDPSGINRKDFDAYVDFLKETLNKKISVVNKFIENL